MTRRSIALLTVSVFLFGLVSCASIPEEHKGAATGAGVGAAAGGLAGVLLGGSARATVIGALAGALVGGAVGHYYVDQKRDREETAKQYGYEPSAGIVVRVEEALAVPASVKPGGNVELRLTYAVLTPKADDSVAVNETREIRHNGVLVGKPEVNITRSGGTYSSSVPLLLPEGADKGTYVVLSTVRAENVSDSREFTFEVQ